MDNDIRYSPKSQNVNRFLILLSTLLCIALAGILLWNATLSSRLKEANAALETAQTMIANLESANHTDVSSDIELWKTEYKYLYEKLKGENLSPLEKAALIERTERTLKMLDK